MELAIIVWIVGVLSTLKFIAETWALWLVVIAIGMYLLTRVNIKQVQKMFVPNRREIWDGELHLYHPVTSCDNRIIAPVGKYRCAEYKSAGYVRLSCDNFTREAFPYTEVLDAVNYREPVDPVRPKDIPLAYPAKGLYLAAYLMAALYTFLPTETTMKYMAGAYLVQSAYESDLMQEATPLAKRAVLNQLKSWAEDAPDLLNLLPQENKDVTTNQP